MTKPEKLIHLLRQASRSWTSRQIADHFDWDIHYTSDLVSRASQKQHDGFNIILTRVNNVKHIHASSCEAPKIDRLIIMKRKFIFGQYSQIT
jgi:hypothetical protein